MKAERIKKLRELDAIRHPSELELAHMANAIGELLNEVEHGIPGVKVQHAIITDNCRANRDDAETLAVAIERIRSSALQSMNGWKRKHGTQFHLVFTVEPPPRQGSK